MDSVLCAKVAYPLVFVITMLLNIPAFFQFKVVNIKLGEEMFYLIDIGYLDQKKTVGKVFQQMHFMLLVVLPLVSLIFFNISLIKALQKSYKLRQRHHANNRTSTKNHVTLMLVIVTMSFALLMLPSELMDFFTGFIHLHYGRTEVFLLVRSFANLLQVIIFSCNFLLYCFFNSHFRKVLKEIVLCTTALLGRQRSSVLVTKSGNSKTLVPQMSMTGRRKTSGRSDQIYMKNERYVALSRTNTQVEGKRLYSTKGEQLQMNELSSVNRTYEAMVSQGT
jgi:hypothetical protein